MKTIEVLKEEEARLVAALKSIRLTIALLEDRDPNETSPPLLEPPREARVDRGGGSKARSARPKKKPNGNACDRAAEGGCSDEFWATKGCKRCGKVQQRCSTHGGKTAATAAARSHTWDHRKGRVDEAGNELADLDDGTLDGTADHPGRLSGAPSALSLDQL